MKLNTEYERHQKAFVHQTFLSNTKLIFPQERMASQDNRKISLVLKENNKFLLENLNSTPIVETLWMNGVITGRDKQIIRSARTRFDQNAELIDCLIQK